MFETGAKDIDIKDLEALFDDDVEPSSPTENVTTEPNSSNETTEKDVSTTKAFAKRLAEEKAKVVNEERESIAKSLGYDSYEDLKKSKERKAIEDKGFDPDEVAPLIEDLVKQRLDNDPRMKELQEFRNKQMKEFGERELADLSKLTNGEISKFDQIPADVWELWKTRGSLKSAYMELHGEELVMKARTSQPKASTSHLSTPSGNPAPETSKRPLTAKEKELWRLFNPKMTTEELDKQMVDK